jgi:hypothetical protein
MDMREFPIEMSHEAESGQKGEEAKRLEQLMAALDSERLTPEQRRELIKETWDALKDAFTASGGVFYENVSEVYRELKGQNLLVRRDDPKRISDAVTKKNVIELAFDPTVGGRYANASLWSADGDQSGLANAFTEGHAHAGGLVAVMGFDRGSLKVEPVPGLKGVGGTRRHLVRGVEGRISPENIRFVVIAVPASFFPEDEMTEDERELLDEAHGGARRVFRGFLFPKAEEGKKAA